MKNFRIYYKTIGVVTKYTSVATVKADTAADAVEIFKARNPLSDIVAIFAE